MIKSKRILTALFAAFAMCLVAFFGVTFYSANADVSGIDTFKIENGASIRMTATSDVQDGLRFRIQMGENTVKTLVGENSLGLAGADTENTVKLYAVIAPADLVDGDFTNIERGKWLEIDESKIYFQDGSYWANAVLTNVKETNRHRAFTMGAVIESGSDSQWATPAADGFNERSIYQTLNMAVLAGEGETDDILNEDVSYVNWYGKDGYPVMVNTETQLEALISDVTNELGAFATKKIAVDSAVKATSAFTDAVADGGVLNAMADELNSTYYNVTFKNDTATLYSYKVKSGATPVFNGWSFTKPADGLNNTYTNSGWDKAFAAVNADAEYTATYTAVANDKFTTFKEFYYEKKTIAGKEEVLTTLGGVPISSTYYPYAYLSNTYEWSAGKALTFNVLNNNDTYEYTFAVYMNPNNNVSFDANTAKLIGYYVVEPGDTQTITVYAEDFDYNTYKYLTIYTNHYITSNGVSTTNPQDAVSTEQADFVSFNVSVYGFKFEDKVKPISEDYLDAALSTTKQVYTGVNTNKNYVCDGDYSMSASFSGSSGFYAIVDNLKSKDLTASEITFKVYNPYTSDYRIYVDLTNGDTLARSALFKLTADLPAKEWSTVTIDTVGYDVKANSGIYIWTAWNEGNNEVVGSTTHTGNNNEKWRAFRLYFDAFKIEEKTNVFGNFQNVVEEQKTIGGTTKDVISISGINASVNRYPYVNLLDHSNYAWTSGKALTFNVYNNSSLYEFTFAIYMNSVANNFADSTQIQTGVEVGYCTVEPNKTQTVVIYAEDFDYTAYKHLTITTSHYMNACGKTTETGGDVTSEIDFTSFNISVYDFEFGDKVKPTTDDYKQASMFNSSAVQGSVNYNKDYIHSGDYSFVFTPYGNYNRIYTKFANTYDWSNISAVTFWVYNPYNAEYYINAGITATTDGTSTNIGQKIYGLEPLTWTQITVIVDGLTLGATNEITMSTDYNTNRAYPYSNSGVKDVPNTNKWRSFRLYIDDFAVVAKNSDATTLLDSVVGQISTGGFYSDTCVTPSYVQQGEKSLKITAAGTWNTATFTEITNTSTILQGKTLTMKVYNPNNFDLIAGVTGYSGYTLTANAWTDIVIDSAAYTDGVLKFYLGNGADNVAVAPNGTVARLVLYVDFVIA